MISAHDAEIIGLIGDGEIIHRDCLDDELRRQASATFTEERGAANPWEFSDFQYWAILEEQSGYSPLSRYDVHTYESQNYDDLEYQLDAGELGDLAMELLNAGDYDVDGDEVRLDLRVDVTPWIQMTCERCHERIE